MTKIGLLSDTHAYLPEGIKLFFDNCDEIWHAGDMGSLAIAEELFKIAPLRAVYGNIDGYEIRSVYPENQIFRCEDVNVFMTHIGGYPGRYEARVKEILQITPIKLFISGHSHILKVMFDKKRQLLHINPGAAGKYGFHKFITAVRFQINDDIISNLEVFELPK